MDPNMHKPRRAPSRLRLLGLLLVGLLGQDLPAADAQNQGFQLNRYEPTPAGEWSFLIDHPWFSSTRYFAGGVTLNYAHDPLFLGRVNDDGSFSPQAPIIEHQLLGHLDLAGSFLDRVTLAFSLPVVFYEAGMPSLGITPVSGAAVSDPRFSLMVRIWGQPDRTPFSVSLGGHLWVPLRQLDGSLPQHISDSAVRGLPKLVLGGLGARQHLRWSFTFGVLIRPEAVLGRAPNPDGTSAGTAVQFGGLVQYADRKRRFAVGPEALLSTIVTSDHAFIKDYTSLELLLGAHYNLGGYVQLGLAGGLGLLREPGTPDGRFLFRVAYAPLAKPRSADRDKDGYLDPNDVCPDVPAGPSPDPTPSRQGCPSADRDQDGVFDPADRCPDVPAGPHPDPEHKGCPLPDRDGDGILDREDLCPDTAAGPRPDPPKKGCPLLDRDGDGVLDRDDVCPDTAAGAHPDPDRKGCPATDRDGDGVFDPEDKCPQTPAGIHPDPANKGCPLPDRDGDSVPDSSDACPDRPGAPDLNPKKNGCPSIALIERGQITLSGEIYFKTAQADILKKSFKVVQAVVDVLKSVPELRKVEIAAFADDRGQDAFNRELTQHRGDSVRTWLIQHGIEPERLSAKGYGKVALDTRSRESKKKQRQKNRRVEFHILDPAPAAPAAPAAPVPGAAPPAAAPAPPPTSTDHREPR
jgi:outer membrane protein OmpA-like peptidoglycan-associated protein